MLRQARIDAGLTLGDVAGTEMSKQAVHLFETGQVRPKLAKLQLIVDRLGLSLDAVRSDRRDHHETHMAELDDLQRHPELERVARGVLRDHTAAQRTKAAAQYHLARALMYTSPKSAAQRARTARRHFLEMGDRARAAEARDCEAVALSMLQDPSALEVACEALDEYRALDDREPRIESRMLSNIATWLLRRARYVDAISVYREALDVAGSLVDLGRLAQIYHGLAIAYIHTDRTREALDYLDRAVQLCRTEYDVKGPVGPKLARLENDYAVHLMRNGRLNQAEDMIRASLDHYAECGVVAERAHSLLTMGELAHLQGRSDEAMDWTGQAIELAQHRSEPVALAAGYQQLGELYADRDDKQRCDEYFHRAMEILDKASLYERRAECEARYLRIHHRSQTRREIGGSSTGHLS